MGLAHDLMRCVSGRHEAVATFANIACDMEREQNEWIATLRSAGVKAAHPDDGWVDRERNTVFFCYPQFDDGVEVGDLIALGWPQWNSKKQQHRIVRVIGRTVGPFQQRWAFETSNISGEASAHNAGAGKELIVNEEHGADASSAWLDGLNEIGKAYELLSLHGFSVIVPGWFTIENPESAQLFAEDKEAWYANAYGLSVEEYRACENWDERCQAITKAGKKCLMFVDRAPGERVSKELAALIMGGKFRCRRHEAI